uniref:RING-type E3 ubiquitin transferase n=1 Tax=Molossus molossus TaxID=27622 RepID=A0A7J8DCM2_MOLMO|nr:makorin ring finger protein 2 [Molossus molossus]
MGILSSLEISIPTSQVPYFYNMRLTQFWHCRQWFIWALDFSYHLDIFFLLFRKKACKYFEQGKGTCPFGNKCLYRHAYPDGRLAEPEKPRKQLSSEGTVRFFNSVRLWDFIENRESQHVPNTEDVDVTELGDLFMHLSGVESSEP